MGSLRLFIYSGQTIDLFSVYIDVFRKTLTKAMALETHKSIVLPIVCIFQENMVVA